MINISLKFIFLLIPIFPLFLPTWSAPSPNSGLGFCVFDCGNPPADYNEASGLISSYLKASQAFYTEFGKPATSTKDIGEYVSIYGCDTNNNRICKKSINDYYQFGNRDFSNLEVTNWFSPSGNYEIEMKSENDQNIFIATPTGKFKKKGFGVSGCFNSKNGKTNILEMEIKGPNVEIANCDD